MKGIILALFLLITLLLPAGASQAQHLVFSTFAGHNVATEGIQKVMTEAYGRLGITIEIKRYPGERAIYTANEGAVDGELYRKKDGIEEHFSNLIQVPVRVHVGDFVAFTTDKSLLVKGWESLLPYSVGYKRGVKAVEMNLLEGTYAVPLTSMEQAYNRLALGWTDIVVDVRPDGIATIRKMGLKGIYVLEPPLIRVESFHYLHAKNRKLLGPLTEVLQQMENEGLIQNIHTYVEHKYGIHCNDKEKS